MTKRPRMECAAFSVRQELRDIAAANRAKQPRVVVMGGRRAGRTMANDWNNAELMTWEQRLESVGWPAMNLNGITSERYNAIPGMSVSKTDPMPTSLLRIKRPTK